jgi:hypothetical protein
MARPEGIEPPTLCLEGRCSIQLSYGRVGYVDSKSIITGSDTILDLLNLGRTGRRRHDAALEKTAFQGVRSKRMSCFKTLRREIPLWRIR